jgi:hypothetical protein
MMEEILEHQGGVLTEERKSQPLVLIHHRCASLENASATSQQCERNRRNLSDGV